MRRPRWLRPPASTSGSFTTLPQAAAARPGPSEGRGHIEVLLLPGGEVARSASGAAGVPNGFGFEEPAAGAVPVGQGGVLARELLLGLAAGLAVARSGLAVG